jgi:cytochrome c-type biogenesis protein CcmH/NrfG
MIALIVSSLFLVLICAWFLSRPFRVNDSEQEGLAQQGQYVLARERLLQQLEQIDVQASEGLLEKESASSETARLEHELAGILKRIDAGNETETQPTTGRETLHSWLAWSGFSLFLLTGAFILYGTLQGETLLSLAKYHEEAVSPSTLNHTQTTPMPAHERSPVTVPPEALAMVSRLESKLAKNPDDGDGWKRLGRSYMVMGRYQYAVSAYASAARLLPDDQQVMAALQQLAEIADRGGRHPLGEVGRQAQVAQPNMQGALERIIQLEERVAAEPENAMSWARLGRAYLNSQREVDARRAYARAYSLEPGNIVILSTYARLVFSANPRDPEGKAVKLFRQLHEMEPGHPDGLWFLGLAAYSEGNLERTTELWTKLLGILPVESEGHTAVRNALDQVQGLPNTQK